MRATSLPKPGKKFFGILILTLTIVYLLATVAIAQTSPKASTNTGYSYTADALSWGDVYAFDVDAFGGTNYSVVNGNSQGIDYYSAGQDANTTAKYNLPYYVGSITYGNHVAPSSVIAMTAHTTTQFRSGVTMGTVEAPIGNGETIPVATTTGTGFYSVVPGSSGNYVVYVYSQGGAPQDVKYSLIDSYQDANAYSGAPATALTFTQVGGTDWYVSNPIAVGNMGWTAYKTGFSKTNDTSNSGDTGTGTCQRRNRILCPQERGYPV